MKLPRTQLQAEVPTSSMADIAFLLIVFFMLTTVFSTNAGVAMALPPASEPGEPEEAIMIEVKPGGDFLMDGTHYTAEQAALVYDYVAGKIQVNARKPIILMTDEEAQYGHMVSILDQLKMVEKREQTPLSITVPTREERALYKQF